MATPQSNSGRDVNVEESEYARENRELFTRLRALEARRDRHLARRERSRADRLRREIEDVTTRIVEFNYGLVRFYVGKFTSHTSAEDSADFESAGLVGLMRAISTYDQDKGSFASWAWRPIKREVLSAVRHADHSNMTAGDFERRPRVLRAQAALAREGYIPSLQEIAQEASLTVEQVARVLNAPRMSSLSAPVGDNGSETALSDLVVDETLDPVDMITHAFAVSALERWGLVVLEPRELFVVVRRFGLDGEPPQRLSTIGEALGLSRETARQIQAKALARLSHPITLRHLLKNDHEA